MNKKINVALQVLPKSSKKDTYSLVDDAIEIIKKSGIKYRVCPFETVLEGYYEDIMKVVKEIHEKLYENGIDNMLVYMKIQSSAKKDVTIEDKMEKYD